MNCYFNDFSPKPKNEATGMKKSEEISVSVFILGWIQLQYGRRVQKMHRDWCAPARP